VSPWHYALTQCYALVLYLRLSFWPYPLVLDYGNLLVRHPADVALQILLVLTLARGTAVASIRRPALGFLGAWFFVILAPSSSVLPLVTQTVAEHRMYLPLAAVVLAVVLALDRALSRWSLPVFGVLAVAAVVGTLRRNATTGTEVVLWRTSLAACPTSARAHSNLGRALYDRGELAEAVGHYETALRIAPEFADSHYNLGLALDRLGRTSEALAQFAAAAELRPSFADAQLEWGRLLAQANRWEEAAAHDAQALRSNPGSALAHDRLGVALVELGHPEDACEHYSRALQIDPSYAEAEGNWAARCSG